jgi:hypothetical protein
VVQVAEIYHGELRVKVRQDALQELSRGRHKDDVVDV